MLRWIPLALALVLLPSMAHAQLRPVMNQRVVGLWGTSPGNPRPVGSYPDGAGPFGTGVDGEVEMAVGVDETGNQGFTAQI